MRGLVRSSWPCVSWRSVASRQEDREESVVFNGLELLKSERVRHWAFRRCAQCATASVNQAARRAIDHFAISCGGRMASSMWSSNTPANMELNSLRQILPKSGTCLSRCNKANFALFTEVNARMGGWPVLLVACCCMDSGSGPRWRASVFHEPEDLGGPTSTFES